MFKGGKKILFLGAIALAIVIIASAAFYRKSVRTVAPVVETPLMRENLPDAPPAVSDGLHLDGDRATYSLKGGEVLRDGQPFGDSGKKAQVRRLAAFYRWMREDPLFFGSSLDTDQLGTALETLRQTHETYLAKSSDKIPIYPLDFLDNFRQTSIFYREFAADVSEGKALGLLDRIALTIQAYRQGIGTLQEALAKEGSDGVTAAFLAGRTFTNESVVAADLDLMSKNAQAAENELAERRKCLTESEDFCRRPADSFAEPAQPAAVSDHPTILSDQAINMPEGLPRSGPYRIDSVCFGDKASDYLYFVRSKAGRRGWPIDRFYLVSQAFYSKVGGDFLRDAELTRRGVKAVPQSADTPYDCPDLGYQAELATLDAFFNRYGKDRWFEKDGDFAGTILENTEKKGNQAEKSLFEAKYPSAEALDYLRDFYAYAYASLPEDAAGAKRELLSRYLAARERLADFGLLLNRVSLHLTSNLEGLRRGSFPNLAYVHTSRLHYSLMFLNFSPDVWRLSENPRYFLDPASVDRSRLLSNAGYFLDYDEAVREFGESNLLKWRKIFNEVIAAGGEE